MNSLKNKKDTGKTISEAEYQSYNNDTSTTNKLINKEADASLDEINEPKYNMGFKNQNSYCKKTSI